MQESEHEVPQMPVRIEIDSKTILLVFEGEKNQMLRESFFPKSIRREKRKLKCIVTQ